MMQLKSDQNEEIYTEQGMHIYSGKIWLDGRYLHKDKFVESRPHDKGCIRMADGERKFMSVSE